MAGFTIDGNRGLILDPAGKNWLARGLNVNDYQMGTVCNDDAVEPLLKLFPGLNAIRLNNRTYDDPGHYMTFVNRVTAKQIFIGFEDHNGISKPPLTGGALATQLAWYKAMAAAFKDNPYVGFGTFNEPGNGTNLAAIAENERAIYDAVRAGGSNALVWMEEPSGGNPGLVGAAAKGYDGQGPMTPSLYADCFNIVWDLHFYGWVAKYSGDYNTVKAALFGSAASASGVLGAQTIRSKDGLVPVLIGEFGNSTTGGAVDADGDLVCQVVADSGLGFIAWGWDPDEQGDQAVTDQGQITTYGKLIASLIAKAAALPSQSGSGSTPALPASKNYASITGPSDASIVDVAGEKVSIVASANGQIAFDGVTDAKTMNVVKAVMFNGLIYHSNVAGNWYTKARASDSWVQGTAPPAPPPVVTADSIIGEIDMVATGLGTVSASLGTLRDSIKALVGSSTTVGG